MARAVAGIMSLAYKRPRYSDQNEPDVPKGVVGGRARAGAQLQSGHVFPSFGEMVVVEWQVAGDMWLDTP